MTSINCQQMIKEVDKGKLMANVKSIIPLNLLDDVLIEVTEGKDAVVLWAKFESLHLMKGLNNCLYMLKRKFQFGVVEGTSIKAI